MSSTSVFMVTATYKTERRSVQAKMSFSWDTRTRDLWPIWHGLRTGTSSPDIPEINAVWFGLGDTQWSTFDPTARAFFSSDGSDSVLLDASGPSMAIDQPRHQELVGISATRA